MRFMYRILIVDDSYSLVKIKEYSNCREYNIDEVKDYKHVRQAFIIGADDYIVKLIDETIVKDSILRFKSEIFSKCIDDEID